MFHESLQRHQRFWNRQPDDRPVVGFNVGYSFQCWFPRLAERLSLGEVKPEDIPVEEFLEDLEQNHRIHAEAGGDCPFTAAAVVQIPWLEAIAGCPIKYTGNSFWSEPFLKSWGEWHFEEPLEENPWFRKLTELLSAAAERFGNTMPLSQTLMRGVTDLLSAIRGAEQMTVDLVLSPEEILPVAEQISELWIRVAAAQLALIPDSSEGYMGRADGLRCWAPDKLVWLQEDACALLSPALYRKYIAPLNRRMADAFPCTAFHVHGSSYWLAEELTAIPEVDVIELGMDIGDTNDDKFIHYCQVVLEHKPLVALINDHNMQRIIPRMFKELPSAGLLTLLTGNNLEETKSMRDWYMKELDRR